MERHRRQRREHIDGTRADDGVYCIRILT